MDRIQRMFTAAGSIGGHSQGDAPLLDTAEQVYVSSLALLKMLKHGLYATDDLYVQEVLNLATKYNKAVEEEDELPSEKLAIANVGRQDAKKHLEQDVSNLVFQHNSDLWNHA